MKRYRTLDPSWSVNSKFSGKIPSVTEYSDPPENPGTGLNLPC